MRLDELIKRRFTELEEQAITVIESSESITHFNEDRGESFEVTVISHSAFVGWATSVLSLLQHALGEDSIHYKHFANHFGLFKGSGLSRLSENVAGK